MTKIDIISGFLGAGKTTLIKKLIAEKSLGEKVVIIENEFGEIGIDGGILRQGGIEIKEINSGCICCTLVGDFTLSLKEVLRLYKPDRIIIEPSGVGKLSDVLKACKKMEKKAEVELGIATVVVDGLKYKMYSRNFSEFFKNQIVYAKTIILSRTQNMNANQINEIIKNIKGTNQKANIITTPWEKIKATDMLTAMEQDGSILLEKELRDSLAGTCIQLQSSSKEKKDRQIGLGLKYKLHLAKLQERKSEINHTADDIFDVWGIETAKVFSKEAIKTILKTLEQNSYGTVLRAKGIVPLTNDEWGQFDFVPGESEIKSIEAQCIGRLCVIGTGLNKEALTKLFEVG